MASPIDNRKKKTTSGRRPVRPGQNASRSEKVQASILKILVNKTFLIMAVAIFSAAGLVALFILWFNKVYADPENVFWGMVSNNLSTQGVTKVVDQKGTGGSQTEYTQLSFTPNPAARSVKVLNLQDESGQATNLALEGILTPKTEYQRYARIQRTAAGSSGNYRDVYNMWLKMVPGENGRSAGFDNAFFGVLLFGNFDRRNRGIIVNQLRDTYSVDFANADKKLVDGRRIYTYKLTVNMRQYAEAVVEYASFLGAPAKGAISPNDFSANDKIIVEVTVDTLTRQVKSVRYNQAVVETYSGYGLLSQVQPPERTVTSEQLQKAIEDAGR